MGVPPMAAIQGSTLWPAEALGIDYDPDWVNPVSRPTSFER